MREKDKFSDTRVSRKELCDYIKQKQMLKLEVNPTKEVDNPPLPKVGIEKQSVCVYLYGEE